MNKRFLLLSIVALFALSLDAQYERKAVVFEVITGTWCPKCPAAARGVDQMHDENLKVAVIEYHSSDQYSVSEGNARISYYGGGSTPTIYSDGIFAHSGGNSNGNHYGIFKPVYDERIVLTSAVDLNMNLINKGDRNYDVSVSLFSEALENESLSLRIMLTESHIEQDWQTLDEVNFVMRDAFPDADGTEIQLIDGEMDFEYSFELDADYVTENSEIVVLVQNDDTEEILNAQEMNIAEAVFVSTTDLDQSSNAYTHMSGNTLNIYRAEGTRARIVNSQGQELKQFTVSTQMHQEDISSLVRSQYFLILEGDNGVVSLAFVKR